MRILVTGCAGFIGSHTCDALLAQGHDVVGVDDFNDYYDPKVKEGNLPRHKRFALHRLDITDYSRLEAVFGRPDKVIHLAARAGVRPSIQDPALYARVNVQGTTNILELCRLHGVSHVVFASSSSVYGANTKIPFSETDPVENMVSPYAVSKRAGELLCSCYHNLYGINIAALRFFTVYGPRGRPDMAPYIFTRAIMDGKPINRFGDGSTKRDYTYISDIVAGILAALDIKGFEIVNLGNNHPVPLNDFIAVIEKAVGRKAIVKQMPMQEGDVPLTYADIAKAGRLLGFRPKVPIEEGIARTVEWMRADLSN